MSLNDTPDFLTLAEAAEYVGVSKDTLRRWDASGKLKPVRRPGSGYRFYRRPDLEPFRLEYRRAEQAADEPDHMFQTLTADIEANPKIREPQQGAHRAVRTHFEASNEPVILQIPVGCGKTGVIATLPFGVAKGRALVITPNLTIRSGVAESLDISNPKNFWRRTGALHDFSAGPFRAVLDGVDANLHDCNASQFVVTNIHQLASSADRWLPQFPPNYFDMIMIDEGHHNVAPSWAKVFDRFPNAKVVSLTATPFRGDGTRPVGKVIYRYPFTRAMVKGYIKQIHSRNVAPSELSFTYRDDTKRHTLEEVLALREHAWFRRGVALAPECNRHIVEASIKYLQELRERSGFRHQIIAVACSVDHARQVRGLYEERGLKAAEIYGEMDRDKQDGVLADLRSGKLDCIVQVQMLGEGFDHPPLSVAAIFRPFASLSPYIQFVGRVMRVVHEAKPDHPDNHAFVVSHVGLNTDAHWDDFRELDFDDQAMVKKWLEAGDENGDGDSSGEPRRFDIGMLVDNEIVGSFINRSFLDPEDDRVLEEMLDHEIGAGLRLRDVIAKDKLRETLRRKQEELSQVSSAGDLPVQPQARRVGARKRLSERTGSPFLLAEAKMHRRAIDANKAGSTIALVQDIGGIPTIMVSTSGFSIAAGNHLSAEEIGYLKLTLTDARGLRWLPELEKRFAVDREFKQVSGALVEALRIGDAEPFQDETVPYEEWLAVIEAGLSHFPQSTVEILRGIATGHYNDGYRFNAIQILSEAQSLDLSLLKHMLATETDPDTIELIQECLVDLVE